MDTVYELPKVTRGAMSTEVYEILKNKIFKRELRPGERLNLLAMEQELGVSRTPLKVALQRLELEGLVDIKPQSGTFVTAPSREEIVELLEARWALEVSAVGLAARKTGQSEAKQLEKIVEEMRTVGNQKNLGQDFARLLELDNLLHSLIVDFSGNRLVKGFWEQVNVRFRATANRYRRTQQELFDAITEHGEIVDALLVGDVDNAQRLMGAHVERARELLLNDLDRQR